MSSTIKKSWGTAEEFAPEKVERSVLRAGGPQELAKHIAEGSAKAVRQFATTADVHRFVYQQLKPRYAPVAARYNLKRALLELGPTGFPFEQYVAKLLQARGYRTKTDQFIAGHCVRHEVDVVAEKDQRTVFVEAKFHNALGVKSDVKTMLYVKARFDDILELVNLQRAPSTRYEAWLITNTDFTSDALQYARCRNVQVMSWAYPRGSSLAELIDATGLHPITALPSLSRQQKQMLTRQGVVVCRDVHDKPDVLRRAGIDHQRLEKLQREARAVCELRATLD